MVTGHLPDPGRHGFSGWWLPILIGALALGSLYGEPVKPLLDIPANSPAFEILRRTQTRSGLLLHSQAFPQLERNVSDTNFGRLDRSDSSMLRPYLPGLRRPLVHWEDSARGHSFFLSPAMETGVRASFDHDSSEDARLGGFGGSVYGTLHPRVSFYTRAMAYTEFTDKAQFTHQFNPQQGESYSVEKGSGDSLLMDRTYNRFEYYILADLPWVTLKAGRDRVHMGPGYFSSLMANRDTPPYYLVEARFDFAPWLKVDNYLLRMTDTQHEIEKFANLHRFEFRPLKSLSIAFQDIVIYQDRGPDARYLLPLVPLTFAESDMGGPDNSAMGFDFLFGGVRNLSVWGELFIDDLLGPSTFFDDFWENRWAGLAGFQAMSPLPWLDADLVVEYGHVEPWTYNGRKPQTSFKHFNVPSASRLGPDSRTWDIQASYRPLEWVEVQTHLEWYDKGLGRSGTLGTIHEDELDGQVKEYLSDSVSTYRSLETSVRFIWDQYLSGRIAWAADFGEMKGHRISVSSLAAW